MAPASRYFAVTVEIKLTTALPGPEGGIAGAMVQHDVEAANAKAAGALALKLVHADPRYAAFSAMDALAPVCRVEHVKELDRLSTSPKSSGWKYYLQE